MFYRLPFLFTYIQIEKGTKIQLLWIKPFVTSLKSKHPFKYFSVFSILEALADERVKASGCVGKKVPSYLEIM